MTANKARHLDNIGADFEWPSRKSPSVLHALKKIALGKPPNVLEIFDWHKLRQRIAPLLRKDARVVKLKPPQIR